MLPNSKLYPLTNSLSPSEKSKGARFTSTSTNNKKRILSKRVKKLKLWPKEKLWKNTIRQKNKKEKSNFKRNSLTTRTYCTKIRVLRFSEHSW